MKTFLLQALGGFIFWTGILTPYMLFIVKTNAQQYFKWVGMQVLIVPILAPLSLKFMVWFVKFVEKKLWR